MCTCSELKRFSQVQYDGDVPVNLVIAIQTTLDLAFDILTKAPQAKRRITYTIQKKKKKYENTLDRLRSIETSGSKDDVLKKLLCDLNGDPDPFWAPVRSTIDLTGDQHEPEDGQEAHDLGMPIYAAIRACLQLEVATAYNVLQARFLWTIVWLLTQASLSPVRTLWIAEMLQKHDGMTEVPLDKLQADIRRFRMRGKNLWEILVMPLGLGALLACPIDIPNSIWDCLSIKIINESKDDNADDCEQIKAYVNKLKQATKRTVQDYEELAKKLILAPLAGVLRRNTSVASYLSQPNRGVSGYGCQQQLLRDSQPEENGQSGRFATLSEARQAPRSTLSSKRRRLTATAQHSEIEQQRSTTAEETHTDHVRCDAEYLMPLLLALGGRIPQILFERSSDRQSRWQDDGTEQEISPTDAGLDLRLIQIFSTRDRHRDVLAYIQKATYGDMSWPIVVDDSSVEAPAVKAQALIAIQWVCFVFPRMRRQHLKYPSIVRALLPLLLHALGLTQVLDIPDTVRYEICEVFLASCKADGVRQMATAEAQKFVNTTSPLYLHAGLALEKSILLRLEGDYDGSRSAISDYYHHCEGPNQCDYSHRACIRQLFRRRNESPRVNAVHALLHRSHVENILQSEGTDAAVNQLDDWNIPKDASPMEMETLAARTLTTCKVLRTGGKFRAARRWLETTYHMLKDSNNPLRSQVVCALIDVYTDLDLPDLATAVIQPEDREFDGVPNKALRRLWVSVVDHKLQQQCYDEVKGIIHHLLWSFRELQRLTISDELLHVRVLIADARIRHLTLDYSGALEGWNRTLTKMCEYASFQGEGFTYGTVYLSISLEHLLLGHEREAEHPFKHGCEILGGIEAEFWIPTLPAWLHFIQTEIHAKTGWSVRSGT